MSTESHQLKSLAPTPEIQPRWAEKVTCNSGQEYNLASPVATRAMVALMDMAAVQGGAASHYGGPAAFAELMSAVHGVMFQESFDKKEQWHQLFHFVNDAGHCENGIYALRANYGFAGLNLDELKKFRSIESRLTGHGEAHLFPESVLISNGPLGSSLPQAQGLAMADAHSGKSRVTVVSISDGAAMEGEAKESFAAIPGFALKGQLAPFVMIISDNNTKLSGRIDKDSFSMEPTFQSLKTLGWNVLEISDGHDLKACLETFLLAVQSARQNPTKPVAIHARTIKGIGNKKCAESASGGHGFPLKSAKELPEFLSEIYDGAEVPSAFLDWAKEMIQKEENKKASSQSSVPTDKIQVGVAAAMMRARKQGLPVISISSDLAGSTGVASFRKEFPKDSIDVGIAESNMVSVAAGYSKSGYLPVVDTFAQFGATKGALPLTMASLSQASMIAVFSHTGFQDAADGASHQALTYYAMLAGIPNVEIIALSCKDQAESLVFEALEKMDSCRQKGIASKSYVFFLGRENFPFHYSTDPIAKLGKPQILKTTTKENAVAIFAVGSMVPQALEAAENLEKSGVGVYVLDPVTLNLWDAEELNPWIDKVGGRVVVVEDHQQIGGYAQFLAAQVTQAGLPLKLKVRAVQGEFGRSAYNAIDLYKMNRLDAQAIQDSVLEFFKS